MLASSAIAVTLALLADSVRAVQDEPAIAIRTVDEALEQLPPIGRDGTWKGKNPIIHPAAAWLKEYIDTGGELSDEQWRRALSRSHAVRVRERWPASEPFAIGMEVPMWLPCTEIRVAPEGGSLSSAKAGDTFAKCGNCADSRRKRARYQVLGSLSGHGSYELCCQIQVERGPPTRARILWSGSVEFPVEVVPDLDSTIPPVHGQELDAEVRKLLVVTLFEENLVRVGVDFAAAPGLSATALSFELTLFEGEKERGTRSFLALRNPGFDPFNTAQGVRWSLSAPPADTSRWSIRVRGRPQDVLRDWDAVRYWDGEITISLADVQRR